MSLDMTLLDSRPYPAQVLTDPHDDAKAQRCIAAV